MRHYVAYFHFYWVSQWNLTQNQFVSLIPCKNLFVWIRCVKPVSHIQMICIGVHNFYFLFLCSALKIGSISLLISTFQLIPFADHLATVRIMLKTEKKKNGRDIWDVWETAKTLNHSIIDVCGFPSRIIFFPIISSKSKPDRSLNHHKRESYSVNIEVIKIDCLKYINIYINFVISKKKSFSLPFDKKKQPKKKSWTENRSRN